MNALVDDVTALRSHVGALVETATHGHAIHLSRDDDLVEMTARTGDLARAVEALLVELVGEIAERSRSMSRDERLTTRMGCRSVSELVQRLTRCGANTAARLERAAKATAMAWDVITGDGMPARLPALRDALLDAEVGMDGVLAVAGPLLAMRERVDQERIVNSGQSSTDTESKSLGPIFWAGKLVSGLGGATGRLFWTA